MMTQALIDTDVAIDIQRRVPNAILWLERQLATPMLPVFAAMEVIQSARNRRELKRSTDTIRLFAVVFPNPVDCGKALADFTMYHLPHGLGLIDALIGATAVGLGLDLATFNQKHFRIVPCLTVYQPYER